VTGVDLAALAATAAPVEELSMGVIGGTTPTSDYARLVHGRLLVEVTLQPSGEQVIATVDTGGADATFYLPINYGARVVIGWAGGQAVILARLNDGDTAFPTLGVTTVTPSAPLFTALKTGDGQLLLIETGADADVLVYSGGSAQVRVDLGDQILLTGRTHIGQGADFAAAPTGAAVGDAGGVELGEAGQPFEPKPAVPLAGPIPPILPPGLSIPVPVPADGVVRVKDGVMSNSGVDPAFWSWLIGFVSTISGWTPVPNDGGAALKVALTAYLLSSPVPSSLTSEHRAGSLNTCGDS
jgi:hypothetical protein